MKKFTPLVKLLEFLSNKVYLIFATQILTKFLCLKIINICKSFSMNQYFIPITIRQIRLYKNSHNKILANKCLIWYKNDCIITWLQVNLFWKHHIFIELLVNFHLFNKFWHYIAWQETNKFLILQLFLINCKHSYFQKCWLQKLWLYCIISKYLALLEYNTSQLIVYIV